LKFNDKIGIFRTALKTTRSSRSAFIALLNGKFKNAVSNLWMNAEIFTREIRDYSVLQQKVGGKEYIPLTAFIFGIQTKFLIIDIFYFTHNF